MSPMIRVLTSGNVEVSRHLSSPMFQRIGVEHLVAASYEQVWSTIVEIRPDLVILEPQLAGGSSFNLCRALKDHEQLASIPVIILVASTLGPDEFEQIQKSSVDDVLALPIRTDEFYHHIAQVIDLPLRRHHRRGVTLELILPHRQRMVVGTVDNINPQGLGARAPVEIHAGMNLVFRIRHDGLLTPNSRGLVTWVDACAPGESVFGLALAEHSPIQTQLLLEHLALFDVEPAPPDSLMGGGVFVALQGDFNELTRFDGLAKRLAEETRIEFNIAALRYMSSAGVRSWCNFLARLQGKQYVFRHASIAFALHASMVPMVIGSGRLLSLEAPYACDACDREELRLLELDALLIDAAQATPPRFGCRTCGGELLFDDMPGRYFAFLSNPP
jgi:two-component system cell cycle response regulator DivK